MVARHEVDPPSALALAVPTVAARDDVRARAVRARLALTLRVTASRLPPRDAATATRRLTSRRIRSRRAAPEWSSRGQPPPPEARAGRSHRSVASSCTSVRAQWRGAQGTQGDAA
eukprot:scaffold58849_cov70-Phaeocystis_antarctica.AAC.10